MQRRNRCVKPVREALLPQEGVSDDGTSSEAAGSGTPLKSMPRGKQVSAAKAAPPKKPASGLDTPIKDVKDKKDAKVEGREKEHVIALAPAEPRRQPACGQATYDAVLRALQ
eukprot:9204338-Lingulodinium_polyedra.AAC.1